MSVDLEAVKAASTPDLIKCAVGAAINARDLLDDAEWLSSGARHARAYATAALAVEEAGKAVSLGALAIMPVGLRAQAPVRRMLEWHQLKLVGGMLIVAVPFGAENSSSGQLAAMPLSQVARILDDAQLLAEDQHRLKQRGLYADMDSGGQVRLPSEITEADVTAQLDRARRAVAAISAMLDPGAGARLTNPSAESVAFARALLSAFTEAGYGRSPQAAAAVVVNTFKKLRDQAAAPDVGASPVRELNGK